MLSRSNPAREADSKAPVNSPRSRGAVWDHIAKRAEILPGYNAMGGHFVIATQPYPILAPPGPWRAPANPQNTFSFLRYLFPHTHQRARDKLSGFRYDHLPLYRLQAQSQIYKALVRRQDRKRARRAAGKGIFPFFQRRKSRILGILRARNVGGGKMSQSNTYGSYPPQNYGSDDRVPGRRRQKVFGYLKAANELRQSYQNQWNQRNESDDDMPGGFPDVEIVRSGDEEMVLFPSYARKHVKKKPSSKGAMPTGQPGAHEDIERPDAGDAEYWKKEWEKYEDDNAIVDVDVRGWIYSPHRTPMSRRNRLVVAVARRLSGIPAPGSSPSLSRTSSQAPPSDRSQGGSSSNEEAAAAREAQKIVERGEAEASAARRGGYSEEAPHGRGRSDSADSQDAPGPGHLRHSLTDSDIGSGDDDPALNYTLLKRRSWNVPANMTSEELSVANSHLMNRLKPFLTVALINTPITVFFFNDEKSQSRSVNTNESGHFSIRASLDFVPTAIRVLASEKLSATEKVHIIDTKGVSLISDIDDTIKHSAIASGAREIFRNTFIRDLTDLTIQGVKEWYTQMASLGVQLHYVSNSPWQLYPLIRSYFSLAGLPPGSFHLKQYTGMLQGIFEPAAERKKGSLDKIMADFPERKFILVGDSGEADLEVYTDVVMENPGQILAVFIRDVTTPRTKKFFDQTPSNSSTGPVSRNPSTSSTASDGTLKSQAGLLEERPSLPTRPKQTTTHDDGPDLIDFSDEPDPLQKDYPDPYHDDLNQLKDDYDAANRPLPPSRPAKPSALRSVSTESQQPTNHDRIPSPRPSSPSKRQPPPKPRRPSASVHLSSTSTTPTPSSSQRAPFSSSRQNPAPTPPPSRKQTSTSIRPSQSRTVSSSTLRSQNNPSSEEGYAASAKRLAAGAYAALPALRSESPDSRPSQPRRGLTSYPAAAARWATGASGGDPAAGGDGGAPFGTPDKKEEMWRRRWARAEAEMKRNNVVLRSWRVGEDVSGEAVRIVERALREIVVDTHERAKRRDGVSESGHYRLQERGWGK